jgi:hypothetical protein
LVFSCVKPILSEICFTISFLVTVTTPEIVRQGTNLFPPPSDLKLNPVKDYVKSKENIP